jgi:hypothetical protein
MLELKWNAKALMVTLLFRLLFGGYVVSMDQYLFNDIDSALTVLIIYLLIGIFATLFLMGKRYGLLGIMGLESIFIILNSVFIVLTLGQIADPGMHDPLSNWWATVLRYLFSLLTLIFAFKVYRETRRQ